MHDTTDVLIIGAGPAGTAAAIELRRAGRSVIVIDKAERGRDKICGDGLTTGALRELEHLGLSIESVPSWIDVDDVHITSPGGLERRFPLPRGRGRFASIARRADLDRALVDLAVEAGAALRFRTPLSRIETDGPGGDGATATVMVGEDADQRIDATWVIAADGMWSPTRKLLGLPDEAYRGEWHAFRQYFTDVGERASNELHVWFDEDLLPGYIWSFPLADGGANVGFGIQRGGRHSVQDMKRLWPDILARPHVRAVLGEHARPEGNHRAWPIPARLGRRTLTHGPVLFVGDAAAATDPMTGEGIGQALETGRAAVEAILAGHDRADTTARYEATLGRGMVRDHRLAGALSRVLASPAGTEWSLRTAGSTDWTRRNFARWLFEDYPRAVLGTPHRWERDVFTRPGAYRAAAELG